MRHSSIPEGGAWLPSKGRRSDEVPPSSGIQSFTDVPPTYPFYGVIEAAVAHGVVSGYSDRTFRPGNQATRGQLAKMIYVAVTQP